MKQVLYVLATLVVFTWSLPAQAEQDRIYVPADTNLSGNYYAVGGSVEMAGNVESDLIVAGGDVVVSGSVGGDVIAVGGNVRITGPVGGNVRIFGGRVELSGAVERNVTIGAGELVFASGSDIKGHVTAAAGTMELRGSMKASLLAAAGQATVDGSIQGPVTFWMDRQGVLDVRDKARLEGGLTYYANQEAAISQGAKLSSQPQRHDLPVPKPRTSDWFGNLVSLFGALVLAMIAMKLVPQWLRSTTDLIVKQPLPSLGFGALWLVAAPIAAIILAITLIGLPLAVLVALTYIAGFLLSPVVAGAAVAELARHPSLAQSALAKLSSFMLVVMGVAVYKLVTFLPVLGGLVGFVGTLFALGALVQKTFRRPSSAYAVQS